MSIDSRKVAPVYTTPSPPVVDPVDLIGGLEAQDSLHLREYWRALYKHRWLIGAVLSAVVAATAIVTFVIDPVYTASSTVQIERQAPKMAPVQEVAPIDAANAYDKYDYYQTQYILLAGRSIAARAIRSLDLETDPRFTGGGGGLIALALGWVKSLLPVRSGLADHERPTEFGVSPWAIDRYMAMLSIEPIRSSRLVAVHFTSKYPELSAAVANRHVEEYLNANLEQRLDMTLNAKRFLEHELVKAKARVDAAEVALNAFRKEQGIVTLDGDRTDIVSARLEDLNKRYTAAQADRIRLEGQYQLIQRRDFESLPDVLSSELVKRLKEALSQVEAERAKLSERFKPGYPKMAEAMARERELKGRLTAEIRKIVEGIESSFMAAQNREADLAAQLDSQRQAVLAQKDVSADYNIRVRDVEMTRSLYSNLLQRLKDVDVAEQIRVSNITVVEKAAVPSRQSSPKPLLNLTAAAAIGLLLGVALAMLLEYLDNTVKTPDDAERKLGLPTLGVIPSFSTPGLAYGTYSYGGAERASGGSVLDDGAPTAANGRRNGMLLSRRGRKAAIGSELIVQSYPRSVISEVYRAIRTNILLSNPGGPPQIVLFTSGTTGEGKTVTAVNEALTLVQAGASVLLIDADIRKPRLHRILEVPNGEGLSTYLSGQSSLDSVIHEVSVDGETVNGSGPKGRLWVLPSGPIPPNPAELLGSQPMRETLKLLRERYDYIIIDTPPILPVTDAVMVATMVDGVVLIARGGQTPYDIVMKSRDRLAYARAKIIGIVLNDVNVTGGDYAYYNQYYYSYYAKTGASDS